MDGCLSKVVFEPPNGICLWNKVSFKIFGSLSVLSRTVKVSRQQLLQVGEEKIN